MAQKKDATISSTGCPQTRLALLWMNLASEPLVSLYTFLSSQLHRKRCAWHALRRCIRWTDQLETAVFRRCGYWPEYGVSLPQGVCPGARDRNARCIALSCSSLERKPADFA